MERILNGEFIAYAGFRPTMTMNDIYDHVKLMGSIRSIERYRDATKGYSQFVFVQYLRWGDVFQRISQDSREGVIKAYALHMPLAKTSYAEPMSPYMETHGVSVLGLPVTDCSEDVPEEEVLEFLSQHGELTRVIFDYAEDQKTFRGIVYADFYTDVTVPMGKQRLCNSAGEFISDVWLISMTDKYFSRYWCWLRNQTYKIAKFVFMEEFSLSATQKFKVRGASGSIQHYGSSHSVPHGQRASSYQKAASSKAPRQMIRKHRFGESSRSEQHRRKKYPPRYSDTVGSQVYPTPPPQPVATVRSQPIAPLPVGPPFNANPDYKYPEGNFGLSGPQQPPPAFIPGFGIPLPGGRPPPQHPNCPPPSHPYRPFPSPNFPDYGSPPYNYRPWTGVVGTHLAYLNLNLNGITEPEVIESFISGGISGCIAAFITTPFDVIKTHQQIEFGEKFLYSANGNGNGSKKQMTGTLQTMRNILRTAGIAGFYAGLTPRLFKVVMACAVMISTYEFGKKFFYVHNVKNFYHEHPRDLNKITLINQETAQ